MTNISNEKHVRAETLTTGRTWKEYCDWSL